MVFSWLADWTKAAEFFRQALAIDRRLQNIVSEVLTLRALANACEKLGQFDEAREAAETLAKLQKTD
jgi:tetratricopeptide (TPR) repeat protein